MIRSTMKATGWKVACSAAILAVGLLIPTAFVFRGPLLKVWYGFRIRIAAEAGKWDKAKWIEDCGIPGRRRVAQGKWPGWPWLVARCLSP